MVPPGVAPSDALISSPIFQGDDGGLAQAMAASAGGGGGADANPYAEYGGVNPDLDPELAMALRLSAEEARAHEESQTRVWLESSLLVSLSSPRMSRRNQRMNLHPRMRIYLLLTSKMMMMLFSKPP